MFFGARHLPMSQRNRDVADTVQGIKEVFKHKELCKKRDCEPKVLKFDG